MSYQNTVTDDEEPRQHEGSLWHWIGLAALATVLFAILRWYMGGPGLAGDALAFSGMILGGLIMIQSQRDFRAAGLERVVE